MRTPNEQAWDRMVAQTSATDNALACLRQLCPPGATVWTSVKHVSRSGMLRAISAHVIIDNEPQWLNGYLDRAGLFTLAHNRAASRVSGCGMDMGFHLVYTLAQTLYPDGFGCIGDQRDWTAKGCDRKVGQCCPSNDHTNGDRDYTPHACSAEELVYGRNHEHWHRDGGYALRHRSW